MRTLSTALCFLAAVSAHAQTEWRFEGKPGSAPAGVVSGKPALSAEVPAAFVYDPVAGKSVPNTSSLALDGARGKRDAVELAWPLDGGSFTLECFARPSKVMRQPGQRFPWLALPPADAKSAGLRLEVFTSYDHVYDWLRAGVTLPGGGEKRLEYARYGGMTMLGKSNPWRHFALVYDARSRRVGYWCDYTALASFVAEKPLDARRGPLFVGGDKAGNGYAGHVDEVRVTPKALPPHEFLRATPHDLRGVSFATPPGKLPPDAGHADVRARFGAVGDGKTDDTHAFVKALTESSDNTHLVGHQTLYVPDGVYLLSDTVQFRRYLVLQGQSRDGTVLKLKDRCPGFGDPKRPRPLLSSGYGVYEKHVAKGPGNNVTHGNYVFDLTLDTGSGNPGAIGFDYCGHNNSAVANLLVRSGDGAGVRGLDLLRPWPGPCLVKDVEVRGFDVGVESRHTEYSLTLTGLRLSGQKKAGLVNVRNGLAIERLVSDNRVPAVVNSGGGQVVLIDSELTGGTAAAAVTNAKDSALFVRNLRVGGYKDALDDAGKSVAAGFGEYVTGKALGGGKTSLGLSVERPPAVPWGEAKDWANVRSFEDKVTEAGDWSPALQAAIDSGAKTVYFPVNGAHPTYRLDAPVHVRGEVVRLFGMRNALTAGKALGERPALIFDGKQKAVSVERLHVPSAEHASAVDLLVSCGGVGKLTARKGCGRLFVEDFLDPLRVNEHQRVWARHLNVEVQKPNVLNDGGLLWVLGFKTEGGSTNVVNRNGGRTEVLGGLIYVTERPAKDVPMFENEGGDLSLVHQVSGYVGNHEWYVQGGEPLALKEAQSWLAGRPLVHLYSSRAAKKR